MSLYLAVKIVWVAAALLGDQPGEDWGTTGWVLLNLVTVGMSAVGVVLGLALAQPWGQRVPAPLVVLFAWVGAGFLVPLLPYMVLSLVLGAFGVGDDGGGGDAGGSGGGTAVPGWETAFIVVGFLGMAVGLAVALPIYLWGRWPSAFAGRLGERTPTAAPQRLARLLPVAWVALVMGTASGLLRLLWGLGGTLGLDPAHVDDMDLDGRLLNASWGAWALIGSWVLWLLLTPRGVRTVPRWLPVVLGFAASGSLFAWNSWRLPLTLLQPGGFVPTEYLAVAVVQHVVGIAVGIVLLALLLTSPRTASRPTPLVTEPA